MAGPHAAIQVDDPRQRLTLELFDLLWETYRQRVPHVVQYEQVVAEAGGRFVNDHIAFRTLASQRPLVGIATLGRLFEALGYQAAGCYQFPDKHLSALHFQHPHGEFPKLFISELRVWELPEPARDAAAASLQQHDHPIDDALLAQLAAGVSASDVGPLAQRLADTFGRCWPPPRREAVERLNEASQYGAWTLLHGYAVNHFTSLVNSHGVESLDSLDKTVAALRRAGVPMKQEIEGAAGSKLRQTATAAADCQVPVRTDADGPEEISWTYAYFELAERGVVKDPETGKDCRFEGFLGPQATQLFEMTRGK